MDERTIYLRKTLWGLGGVILLKCRWGLVGLDGFGWFSLGIWKHMVLDIRKWFLGLLFSNEEIDEFHDSGVLWEKNSFRWNFC